MADETATLAAYVANLKFEDIPEEVLARAKVLTLDFLGSAIRARRDAESTPSLLKMLEALTPPCRRVRWCGRRCSRSASWSGLQAATCCPRSWPAMRYAAGSATRSIP